MTTLENNKEYKFKLESNDFYNNWENSKLLKKVRYRKLVWIKGVLHSEYTAIYLGEEINILVKK